MTSVTPPAGLSKALDVKFNAILAEDPDQPPLSMAAMALMQYDDINVLKADVMWAVAHYAADVKRLYAVNHATVPKRTKRDKAHRTPTPRPRKEPVPYGHPDCRVMMPYGRYRLWKTLTATEHRLAADVLRGFIGDSYQKIDLHLNEAKRLEGQAA